MNVFSSLINIQKFAVKQRFTIIMMNLSNIGSYSTARQNHYEVLGIHPESSSANIRAAYLNLSKELHPDTNHGLSEVEKEVLREKFVIVNEAYSVLSNKGKRRKYDLTIRVPNSKTEFTQTMSFEDRAKHMGFKSQDPNYYSKNGNYHRSVALWCLALVILGPTLQGMAVWKHYKKISEDKISAGDEEIVMTAGANAMRYTTLGEQRRLYNSKNINV